MARAGRAILRNQREPSSCWPPGTNGPGSRILTAGRKRSRAMREERFDVAVAGCGVAGLSAAVAAAECGARVVVLERAPREERGGEGGYTQAYLRMKSEAEVTEAFETHLAENGSGAVDPDLIAELARAPADRAPFARALGV